MSINVKNRINISRLREIAKYDHSHTPADVGADPAGSAAEILAVLQNHKGVSICSEEGVHNIRWYEDQLQVFMDGQWQLVTRSPEESAEPALDGAANVESIEAHQRIYLKWTDPEDYTDIDGTEIKWAGTKIVRKAGSPPLNHNDGIQIIDSKTKNKFSEAYYIDVGLVNGICYYYAIVPYTDENVHTFSKEAIVTATPCGEHELAPVTASFHGMHEAIAIRFQDQKDVKQKNAVITKWIGSMVIRKQGGYPESEADGTEVFYNRVRDKYKSKEYVDQGLVLNQQYHYSLITYFDDGSNYIQQLGSGKPVERMVSGVSNVEVRPATASVFIRWRDPEDLVIDGIIMAKWASTKVVRKPGSFPENINDGTVILDCTHRNEYAAQGYTDMIPHNTFNELWYYRFFIYTDDGRELVGGSYKAEMKFWAFSVMWMNAGENSLANERDEAFSFRPSIGNTVGKSYFDNSNIYRNIRLCNLVNGRVTAYEGDQGFTRTPPVGDVMVEIPKFYVTGNKINGAPAFTVCNIISGAMNGVYSPSGSFISPAHQGNRYHPQDYERIYVSAYPVNSDLRSISGTLPVKSNYSWFRDNCRRRGKGYSLWSFAAYWTIAFLYLIEAGDFNSQKTIGRGCVDTSEPNVSGTTDSIPYHSGRTTISANEGENAVKYRHLENLWGNLWQTVTGAELWNNDIYISNDPELWYANNITQSCYTKLSYSLCNTNGYIKAMGQDHAVPWALLPTDAGASAETYFSGGFTRNTGIARSLGIGGNFDSGGDAGIFAMNADVAPAFNQLCTRLMYLPED